MRFDDHGSAGTDIRGRRFGGDIQVRSSFLLCSAILSVGRWPWVAVKAPPTEFIADIIYCQLLINWFPSAIEKIRKEA